MRTDSPPTVGSAIAAATSELLAAGCETARLDARLLVAHVASVSLEAQIRAPDRLLPNDVGRRLREAVTRRAHRAPLAQIIGRKEFWSLPFTVSADVLIPRPDSEVVIDAVLRHLGDRAQERLRVLDLGTGSGCLLHALLSEIPEAVGVGKGQVAPHEDRHRCEPAGCAGRRDSPLHRAVDSGACTCGCGHRVRALQRAIYTGSPGPRCKF